MKKRIGVKRKVCIKSKDELLLIKVRLCVSTNIGILVLALLGIGFIMSLLNIPIMFLYEFEALHMPLLFFYGIIIYIVQYGFFVLVLRLHREQQAVLGHLFAGFRDLKRALFFGLFLELISISVTILFTLVPRFGRNFFILFFLFAFLMIFFIRYGFVWFLLYDHPDLKVREALKQSALITKGERLKFIRFCIKSTGSYFIVGVLAFVVSQAILTSINFDTVFKIIMTWLLCVCVGLLRICIAFAAWYTSHNDSIVVIDNANDTVIELSASRTDDSSENTGD